MTLEDLLQTADEAMFTCSGNPLTDIQRMILRESLAGKGYERMEGYAPQHIKNEGKKLWDLLSEALGEKVSKTNFKGALEKRLQSTGLALEPPTFPAYNPQTWVGREALVEDLLAKLQNQTRLLWITGISGVGKTTLGECLASQAWERDPTFQWHHMEIEEQSPNFTQIAAGLLAKLGDKELDPQDRNDPKRLTERLIRKLQIHHYWIQLDSLERLLNPTEFADSYWLTFLQRCLTESNFSSRFVFTAQVLPPALAELSDRYPNHWHAITLKGLIANEQHNEYLDLFNNNGITIDESNQSILTRIGQIYEGHPLVLQVIAKEVLAAPFNGNVVTYWQRYNKEFEQVARELQTEHVNSALYSQALQRQVRRRVEISLKRLPTDALALLCRSSVYRRPVPETFWLAMISDRSDAQQQEAYLVLGDRALVEREGIHSGEFLIRQHNLIRDIAYDLLKQDPLAWKSAERKAADLWLTAYQPAPDSSNLETVRGYLEAFRHYYEVEDWVSAKRIFLYNLNTPTKDELHWQLGVWGYYQEQIQLYNYSFELADLANDFHWISKALGGLGYSYYSVGNYSKSVKYFQKQLDFNRKKQNKEGEAEALGGLSDAYRAIGKYAQAIDYCQQSLEIFRVINSSTEEARVLGIWASIYLALGQCDQAIERYRESWDKLRSINISDFDLLSEKARILVNIGSACLTAKKYSEAEEHYREAWSISIEIEDVGLQSSLFSAFGNLYEAKEEYSQAKIFFKHRLAIAKHTNDLFGEAYALNSLGILSGKLDNFSEALDYFYKARLVCLGTGSKSYEIEILSNTAILNNFLGNNDLALTNCQQALAIATELGIPLKAECEALLESLGESHDS